MLPLHRAIFLGEAVGPWKHIRTMQPWLEARPDEPWDVLQADACLQFLPWRHLVLQSYQRFEIPFWNPYELAGTPLLANSQSGGLYPPHIILGIARVPVVPAVTLLAWFHLFLVGYGCWLLVRKLQGSDVGGVFAGISFQLSAFSLSWVGLASVPSTVAWIPWVLLCVLNIFDTETRTSLAVLKLAGVTAMLLLAGHLQFAAYGLMAALLLWVVLVMSQKFTWRSMTPIAGLLLGAMIAAPQVLPVLDYGKYSHRSNAPSEEGYSAYSQSAIQPFEFAALPSPMIHGNPRIWSSKIDKVSAYWPVYVKRGANFAESAIGLGPLVLGLLFLAPFRQRRVQAVSAIGVLGLLLAGGTYANRLLYFGFPGWSSTGSPGRAIVLFVLVACLLAGLGIREIETKGRERLLLALVPVLFLMFSFAFMMQFQTSMDKEIVGLILGAVSQQLVPIVIASLIACIVLSLVATKKVIFARWIPVSASVICPILIGTATLVPTGELPTFNETPPEHSRVAWVNRRWSLFIAPPATVPPNLSSLFGIRELSGYDSLTHRDTVALLRSINGQDPSPPENGNMMFVKPGFDPDKLADAGVGPTNARLMFPGSAEFSVDSANKVEIKTEGEGLLVLKDRMMPGWSAQIDNAPLDLAADLWKRVTVPAGKHTITFSYDPPGFKSGLILMGVAFGLIGLGSLVERQTRGKRHDTD